MQRFQRCFSGFLRSPLRGGHRPTGPFPKVLPARAGGAFCGGPGAQEAAETALKLVHALLTL
eukprot:5698573-Alexandrium_andersonii.AAC.1